MGAIQIDIVFVMRSFASATQAALQQLQVYYCGDVTTKHVGSVSGRLVINTTSVINMMDLAVCTAGA